MYRALLPLALLAAAPLHASEVEAFDPASISEVDAINCHLDVPSYNAFALALIGEDDLAGKRGWKKVETDNPFLTEFDLPEPILVTGTHSTRRIAITSGGILAILDLPDPEVIARAENMKNEMDAEALIDAIVSSGKATRAEVEAELKFRKFEATRVIVDVTEPATPEKSFGTPCDDQPDNFKRQHPSRQDLLWLFLSHGIAGQERQAALTIAGTIRCGRPNTDASGQNPAAFSTGGSPRCAAA